MAKTATAEIPATWSELGHNLGVSQPIVSMTARNMLAARTTGPMPTKVPPPRTLGAEFVAELTETITRTRKIVVRGQQAPQKLRTAEIDRLVREKLDEFQDLLGDNLLEKVADELGLELTAVRKVFEDRFKALEAERKIKQKMLAWQQADALAQRAATVSAAVAKAEGQETARTESVSKVVRGPRGAGSATPKTPPAARSMTPSSASEPPAPTPEPPNELETFLRASWIAVRAGLPKAQESAVTALRTRFPKLSAPDALEAIAAAYSARTTKQKADMERRAQALAREHGLPPLLPIT